MEQNLLDRMLASYKAEQKTVTVTLQNKVRVSGKIRSFDSYIMVLDGQRQEIIYRHAVSSVSLPSMEEAKRAPAPQRPVVAAPKRKSVPAERSRTAPHAAPNAAPSAKETSINTGMKEGLLKWMQDQKAAK